MSIDFQKLSTDIQCITNCIPSSKEGTIVNLNPEFIVSEDQINQDGIFPWMHNFSRDFDLNKVESASIRENGIILNDAFLSIGGNQRITDEWRALKKAWSLHSNGKNDLSEKKVQNFFSDKKIEAVPNLFEWQFGFSKKFIGPTFLKYFKKLNNFCKGIYSRYPSEFKIFKKYYHENFEKDHYDQFLELYTEYFNNFSEYSQVLLYVKNKKEIPDDLKAASTNFKKTKMFYGNAYEIYTSNIIVLACLNNIASGRPFDQFQQMNLNKYATINKANRANPFKDVDELSVFATCLESSFRNASHHGAMKFNNGNIKYKSGGTGAERIIEYTKYLELCNKIFLLSVVLFMNEFVIGRLR